MAYSITWYEKENLAIISVRGAMGGNDALQVFEEFVHDPRNNSHLKIIWDCRYNEPLVLDWSDLLKIKELATLQSIHPTASSRIAILVSRELNLSAAKLATSLLRNHPREIKIFINLNEAASWLEIPDLTTYLIPVDQEIP